MFKNKIKKNLLNFILFCVSILLTFLLINFILFKISSQNIFPRPLAASLSNTLLTFYPSTYNKKKLNSYTAVIGNSVAQGNGDAYLENQDNYSITHFLHDIDKKNYLIFGRAGQHSVESVINLIKIKKLTNHFFMYPNLKKPNSIVFYFYEGIDLVWNHGLYNDNKQENESVEDYTLRLIKNNIDPNLSEKIYNFFPVISFLQSFLDDFKVLFSQISTNKSLKESFILIVDRIKKALGFYIVLGDKPKNSLTWTNSLKDHENIKDIRPIQGAGTSLNKKQTMIGLNVFFESLRQVKLWSQTKDITVVYIPAPISIYDWNEPIIYEPQDLSPKSKKDIKSITNNQNKLKNIFIRQQIKKFTEKNNIFFIDPTNILIEKGKLEVLHGPLDWGHLNYKGYKTVSDFITQNKPQN